MKHVTFHLPSFLRRVRIHGGEFDSSARAMNRGEQVRLLQADLRIVRGSTIERKQMSTTIKRVALVAVAALGLGVLSVAPSSAAVINMTVTSVNGTATTAVSDSTTAASMRITFTAQALADSVSVTSYVSTLPTGATAIPQMGIVSHLLDTTTSTVVPVLTEAAIGKTSAVTGDSVTVIANIASATTGQVSANFMYYLLSAPSTAGTYTITAVVTPFSAGAAGTSVTKTFDIVVSALAAASKVASAAFSTLSEPSATSAVATVSSTNAAKATLDVVLKNASDNTAAKESVTATITGPGTIGFAGGAVGKSVVLAYTGTSLTLSVYSDGTAGSSTINVSTPSVTFPTKSITFFAKAAKTITATVVTPVLGVGGNTNAISATAVDANGTAWTGAAFIVASAAADALVGGSATTPVACTFNTTDLVHYCPVTTIASGTAKFKIIDAATVALATATSNEVTVTVSSAAAATVKLSFDKATYGPFEKATITVTPLDASGKAISAKTASAFLAAGGISSTYAFSAGSDTLTATTFATSYLTGALSYTVYMPSASGDVKISATGGAVLPVAGQVAVSATATIVNASNDASTDAANEATDAANAATDAALAAADAADAATAAAEDASAAVATLATAVNTALASLKKQITALAALVKKLLKK